jgi:chemotaxis protein methyltransferase CheR
MEYELNQREFDQLSRLVYEKSGINLHQGKQELVRARLSKRLRETGLNTFQAYYDFVLREDTGQELVALLDSISTNLTSFFREPAHFDYLRQEILPQMAERQGLGSRRLWVWCAGCSSGEEPYTIALCLLEGLPSLIGWDVKIVATDISTRTLETAQAGIYKAERVSTVPRELLSRYFQRGVKEWAGHYRVKPAVRRLVDFRRANLLEGPPVAGQFEVIFCRNVMIYFDAPTQERVIGIFRNHLLPGGVLFIGHSESLARVKHNLRYLKPAVYCKQDGDKRGR